MKLTLSARNLYLLCETLLYLDLNGKVIYTYPSIHFSLEPLILKGGNCCLFQQWEVRSTLAGRQSITAVIHVFIVYINSLLT